MADFETIVKVLKEVPDEIRPLTSFEGVILMSLYNNDSDLAYQLSVRIALPKSSQWAEDYPIAGSYLHTDKGKSELWYVIALKREDNSIPSVQHVLEDKFTVPYPDENIPSKNYIKVVVIHFKDEDGTFEVTGKGIVRYSDATDIGGGSGSQS